MKRKARQRLIQEKREANQDTRNGRRRNLYSNMAEEGILGKKYLAKYETMRLEVKIAFPNEIFPPAYAANMAPPSMRDYHRLFDLYKSII